MDEIDIETIQRVQLLFILQDEREHFMKIFEESYNIYIANKTKNLPKFRQLVEDSTFNFKRISKGFLEISKKMRSLGYNRLADIIISLQKAEDDRLHYCALLQMAKQDFYDNNNVTPPESLNRINKLKELHKKSIEKIDHQMEQLSHEIKKKNFLF